MNIEIAKEELRRQLDALRKDIASRIIDCMRTYNLKYSALSREIYGRNSRTHSINKAVNEAFTHGRGVRLDTLMTYLAAAEKLAREQEKARQAYKQKYGGLDYDFRAITRN